MVRVSLYVVNDSPLHRAHPMIKVLGLLVLFFVGFRAREPLTLLVVTSAVAVGFAVAEAWIVLRRSSPLLAMVGTFTFVAWLVFQREGAPVVEVAGWVVTDEGLAYATGMALRLVGLIAGGMLFLAVTTVEELGRGLESLGCPMKLRFVIGLSFRLVPLFLGSAFRVVEAQEARGLDLSGGSLLARLRAYVPIIVPVFMGSLRRADAMSVALESRGFGAAAAPTGFPHPGLGAWDRVALAVLVIAVAGSVLVPT